MTPDNPKFVAESETRSNHFAEALQRLSSTPEQLAQIRPEDVNPYEIRKTLIDAGYNLVLTETERASLQEKQFRSLDSGRGVGVVAVLNRDRAQAVMNMIPRLAEGRGKIAGKEGTEGRGLRQFVADTLNLVTTPNPNPEDAIAYCTRLNERVLKGYRKAAEYKNDTDAQEQIGRAFNGVEDKTDVGEFSSIPPHTLDILWAFITQKE